MGIRYYGYPLAPEFVERAMDDPYAFLSDDPLADAWGLGRDRRGDMLYLDKCWSQLQKLTRHRNGEPRRSHALFRGQVTPASPGSWYPWTDVLSPNDVDDVARDLALLDATDVEAMLTRAGARIRDSADERQYVVHYLGEAQKFTARLSRDGWGVVYLIG